MADNEQMGSAPASAPSTNGQRNAATIQRIERIKLKVTPGLRISLLLGAIFNVAMLIVGVLAVHKCPVEERIPLFLIATGAIGLFSKFLSFVKIYVEGYFNTTFAESLLYSVELMFFIFGSYWVYKELTPSFDQDSPKYCQKTAYYFALTYISFIYAILVAVVAGFCCFVICILLLASQIEIEPDVEANTTQSRTVETKNEPEGPHE